MHRPNLLFSKPQSISLSNISISRSNNADSMGVIGAIILAGPSSVKEPDELEKYILHGPSSLQMTALAFICP